MTYMKFVFEEIKKYDKAKPIYSKALALTLKEVYGISYDKASAACAVAVKRILSKNLIPELRMYQKGIYYITSMTPFGELPIDKNILIEDKYLRDGSGYEGGLSLLHKIGFTTQIPNERTIITNKASGGTRRDEELNIIVKPPKAKIQKENRAIFQALDILDMLDEAPIDVSDPSALMLGFMKMNNIGYAELLSFAYKYYSKNTIIKIAWIAQWKGVYNEITF